MKILIAKKQIFKFDLLKKQELIQMDLSRKDR